MDFMLNRGICGDIVRHLIMVYRPNGQELERGNKIMPRTITKAETLFTFDELSDEAKETARGWMREDLPIDNDYEFFEYVADVLGVTLASKSVPLMSGKTRQAPIIYYSGFWSQGDGACFEGSYSYKPGASKAIRDYAPNDKTLHRIADELQAVQRRYFYKLNASCTHRGHYYHSGCMSVSVCLDDSYASVSDTDEDKIIDAMRSLADWFYNQLEREWEYQNSDEAIDEGIRANEYEFDEGGLIA